MSKRGSAVGACANSFAALALHGGREPEDLLAKQSIKKKGKTVKKQTESHPMEVLESAGWKVQQAKRPGNSASNANSRSTSAGLDRADSLQAALEAIAAAESKELQHQQWLKEEQDALEAVAVTESYAWQQQRQEEEQQEEQATWAAVAAAEPDAWQQHGQPCSQAAWGCYSPQPVQATTASAAAAAGSRHSSRRSSRSSSGTIGSMPSASPAAVAGDWDGSSSEQPGAWPPPSPASDTCSSAEASAWAAVQNSRGAQVLCWQRFALSFAAAARDCGDEDAADGAVQFGLSTSTDVAGEVAADESALLQLVESAPEAAAAGLSWRDLLVAQQEELLLQANRGGSGSSRAGRGKSRQRWRQLQLDWDAVPSRNNARAGSSSKGSSLSTSPEQHYMAAAAAALKQQQQQQQRWLADEPCLDDDADFPTLAAPAGGGGWEAAGPSPHAVRKGWRGGRLAPKAKGIKLVHSSSSSRGAASRPGQQQRPTSLDLHWDLLMDGLVPKQHDGLAGAAASNNNGTCGGLPVPDPWGGMSPAGTNSCRQQWGSEEAAAADRTRQLLAAQEQAAAGGGGGGSRSRSSSQNRLGQDTVRLMMDKAAKKTSRLAAAAAGDSTNPAECAVDGEEEEGSADDAGAAAASVAASPVSSNNRGCKDNYGYSWNSLFQAMLASGWVPVAKASGGGGSHFKLRRVLPLSGVTQTMIVACTPSDSQRGTRNAAAALKRSDDERDALESTAAAVAKPGGSNSAAAAAAAAGPPGKKVPQQQRRQR